MPDAVYGPGSRIGIVSDLDRGRSVIDVAAKYHVSHKIVEDLREQYGPGMGELATSAEKLRAGTLTIPTPTQAPATGVVDGILTEAEAMKNPALTARVAKIRDLVDQLQADTDTLAKRQAAEALVKQRRSELAKAEALLAEAKGTKSKPKPGDGDTAKVRAWAAEQGIPVGVNGRISAAVRDQYDARDKS